MEGFEFAFASTPEAPNSVMHERKNVKCPNCKNPVPIEVLEMTGRKEPWPGYIRLFGAGLALIVQ